MIRAAASMTIGLALAFGLATASEAKPKPKPAEPSILQPAGPPPAPKPPPPPPAPSLRGLLQASEAQVRARLGAPDVARHEGSGGLWTYRFRTCALFVYFRAEDGQPLRVSGAAAGARRRGQKPPGFDACIAEFRDHDNPTDAEDPIQAILDQPGATPQ